MINKLPKIELHCHLDGSVRVDTIIDIAKKEGIKLDSYKRCDIEKLVQVPNDCTSLNEYLKRFDLPNKVMQSSENIKRITFELLEDAQKENIKYIEIRFAPLLHLQKGLSIEEVIQSAIDGINQAQRIYDIKGNIILSCMRNMSEDDAILLIEKGRKFLNKGVVAIDLAGPEEEGFANKYKRAIELARSYGYNITIHAGEAASAQNVIDAINILKAQRIGHGVRIKDMKDAYDLVKKTGVVLEMCPTSNIQTKAIECLNKYPLYDFYKDGIKLSINTDNRTVSNIDLSNEIKVISDEFNMSKEKYKDIYLNTIDAIFADESTKKWLRRLI
ncbi:MAG TPA: adenosine deaminase [Romboutsia timonensis]|uniref:Adenosine deaminase n=1 Tax=Romboutsia timonensis TaxID=1776391 RepID=A0A921T055_9FIRM|nr:adenosine deaminase [Romboutsia timonensis]